jgi:hypothetical protein
MMEKRRVVRHMDDEAHGYGNTTIVNYNATLSVDDPDTEEKKNLYTKPRFLGILLSAIILVLYGMFVLSRTDIVHIALFHHTGDYHANNHVVDKIEEHRGIFIHDNRDVDVSSSALGVKAQSNKQTQLSSANKVSKEDPKLLNSLGFKEEEFIGTARAVSEKKSVSGEDQKLSTGDHKLISRLRQANEGPKPAQSVQSEPIDLKNGKMIDDPLKTEMEAQIAVVRKMKYQDHVVMEVDEKAKIEISKLQDLVRRYIVQTYGAGPHYLEMELEFPRSMEQAGRQRNEKLVIELAPIELVPYSVYYFLQLVDNWKVIS